MYYYSKSEDKPYNRYNAIILTFEKSATQGGGPSWWTMKEGSKKFRTSGDFDYFSVAPIDREEKNDYSERTGRFLERFSEKLFDPCSSIQASEVKVEDSYQHLFGLAKEYEDNGDIFWRKTERLPYTFVSLVQFKGKHIDSAQLDELLIKYVNKFNDFQFRIFLSLEISDVIVFVKVGCYQDGLDCVNEMNDLNCYVYSMLGVESEMSLPEIVFA
ncbi:MAG: hypothetical protein LBB49_03465, partial [Gracilibacteraceae bacterium]|nr:hypothetical protein [Gracilibacteraceae bacterium]